MGDGAKHTAGVWRMTKCSCCEQYTINTAGSDGRFDKPDAYLIVAAPLMFEAIEAALAAREDGTFGADGECGWKLLREAYAAAKGES
jgi:hypothetical protein